MLEALRLGIGAAQQIGLKLGRELGDDGCPAYEFEKLTENLPPVLEAAWPLQEWDTQLWDFFSVGWLQATGGSKISIDIEKEEN